MKCFAWVEDAFHRPETKVYRYVQGVVWVLIALSVLLFLLDVLSAPAGRVRDGLRALDQAILWVFAVEITLRVVSFRPPALELFDWSPLVRLRHHLMGRLLYCVRPLSIIDILTVLALVPALRGLRALRLLRLLRTTRIFRYSNPFLGLFRSSRRTPCYLPLPSPP